MSNKNNVGLMMPCERIWVGKYKDNLGTFEILVPACDRDNAIDSIKTCLDKIKKGEIGVTQKIVGDPDLLYIDEVGKCDYIRD
jgi:hypothetical protein